MWKNYNWMKYDVMDLDVPYVRIYDDLIIQKHPIDSRSRSGERKTRVSQGFFSQSLKVSSIILGIYGHTNVLKVFIISICHLQIQSNHYGPHIISQGPSEINVNTSFSHSSRVQKVAMVMM